MSYRDPHEAMHAQNESLKKELDAAHEELARMRHQASQREAPTAPDNGLRGVMPALLVVGCLGAALGITQARARAHQGCPRQAAAEVSAQSSMQAVYANIGRLHERNFFEPVSYAGTVREAAGIQTVQPGERCALRVEPVSSPMFNCRWQITCGSTTVYGLPHQGFTQCTMGFAGPLRAVDSQELLEDGDPRMTFDLALRRAAISDTGPNSSYRVVIDLDAP